MSYVPEGYTKSTIVYYNDGEWNIAFKVKNVFIESLREPRVLEIFKGAPSYKPLKKRLTVITSHQFVNHVDLKSE